MTRAEREASMVSEKRVDKHYYRKRKRREVCRGRMMGEEGSVSSSELSSELSVFPLPTTSSDALRLCEINASGPLVGL